MRACDTLHKIAAIRSAAVVILCAVWLTGCTRVLMKTPAVIAEGGVDPFEYVLAERQSTDATVFVASARTVSGSTDPARFYSTERSREVRLGRAIVRIGDGMSWEELTAASRARTRRDNPTVALASYEEFGPLWSSAWPPEYRFNPDWVAPATDREPADRFVEAVESMLADSRRRQITVYVHGFNTKFANNVMMAGEFYHYMNRDEVMISFDWASKGDLFSYQVDKANAEFAVRQFRCLLEFLAEDTSAERINIVAHSAGNPIVVEALRQISLRYHDLSNDEARRRSKIGRVVLAAPDMDFETCLSAGVDGATRVTQGWTVYASRKDKALSFSGGIFGDVRVGNSIGKLSEYERDGLIRNKGQWIDVTAAQRRAPSFLGHSYYHQNPWVSSDVLLYLRTGASGEERGLVRDLETGFLTFPADYEEQLPEIVDRLRQKYDTGPLIREAQQGVDARTPERTILLRSRARKTPKYLM